MNEIANTSAPKWIAYVRRSTDKQGQTIAEQIKDIKKAAEEAGAILICEPIEETESGKESDRKGLNYAIALANKHKATIVVSKYDRLSRDLPFASHLIFDTKTQFKILKFPEEAMTDPLMFGVYFGLAMREAQLISERTSKVRQAQCRMIDEQGCYISKAGKEITYKGNPNGAKCMLTKEIKEKASATKTKNALKNENNIKSIESIREYLQGNGTKSLTAIAAYLSANDCYTSRKVFHTATSVKLLCQRYGIEVKGRRGRPKKQVVG